ncbi:unnamed protein product [Amoebophrya sp. A120]|nr:unnamed protein product [Amoebophrya sp. A120]|eukprot:GSA120T00006250001.1
MNLSRVGGLVDVNKMAPPPPRSSLCREKRTRASVLPSSSGFFPHVHRFLFAVLLQDHLSVHPVAGMFFTRDCGSQCRAVRKRSEIFSLKCIAKYDSETDDATNNFCAQMCSPSQVVLKGQLTTTINTCAPKRKRTLLQFPAARMKLFTAKFLQQHCPPLQPCNCSRCVCPETVHQTVKPPAPVLHDNVEEEGKLQKQLAGHDMSPMPTVPNFDQAPQVDGRERSCPEFEPCNCSCQCGRPVEA